MKIAQSVAGMLRNHVTLELENRYNPVTGWNGNPRMQS